MYDHAVLHEAAKKLAISYGCDKIYFEFWDDLIIIHKLYTRQDGNPYKEGQNTSYMYADLVEMAKKPLRDCYLDGILNRTENRSYEEYRMTLDIVGIKINDDKSRPAHTNSVGVTKGT
jgi:hypothetical protein